ncbi:MAG: DUF4157 domain-containing protein [Anaerolineae bacterium]|nr:DUF4157 domain-containing protein [Anaerolineae bacterium]
MKPITPVMPAQIEQPIFSNDLSFWPHFESDVPIDSGRRPGLREGQSDSMAPSRDKPKAPDHHEQATVRVHRNPGQKRPWIPTPIDQAPGSMKDERTNLAQVFEASNHLIINSQVQAFLTRLLDIRVPTVKIYANSQADAVAKAFDADAVTLEDKILFREGYYAPDDVAGLALLGHEFTHTAQASQQGVGRVAPQLYQAQEQAALCNEQKVIHHFSQPSPAQRPPGLSSTPLHPPRPSSTAPTTMPTPVKTALSSRDISGPMATKAAAVPEVQLSEQQLKFIKEAVYRDIMMRIKTDLERGG